MRDPEEGFEIIVNKYIVLLVLVAYTAFWFVLGYYVRG